MTMRDSKGYHLRGIVPEGAGAADPFHTMYCGVSDASMNELCSTGLDWTFGYGKARYCKRCGRKLAYVNRGKLCFACQDRERTAICL